MNATTPTAFLLSLDALLQPDCLRAMRAHAYIHAGSWLRQHLTEPWLETWLGLVLDEQRRDLLTGRGASPYLHAGSASDPAWVEGLCAHVTQRLRDERDTAATNQLAGHIVVEAIAAGEVAIDLFDDVPRMVERWTRRNIAWGVYSRYDEPATRAILAHSNRGNMSEHLALVLSAPTVEARSSEATFAEAVQRLGVAPAALRVGGCEVAEMSAAANAGCQPVLIERQGIMNESGHGFRTEVTLLAL